jgi:hypothetical protein
MISLIVTILIYCAAFGLLYWLAEYLLALFPLPEPLPRLIRAVIVVVLVLLLIGLLLELTGAQTGLPRLRWQ